MNTEKNKLQALSDKDSHSKSREERLEADVHHKDEVIKRLETSLAAVKKEADAQLKLTVGGFSLFPFHAQCFTGDFCEQLGIYASHMTNSNQSLITDVFKITEESSG